MFIRFTDFYGIAHDQTRSNINSNLVELLCADIQNNNIRYLKEIKFEYYDIDFVDFNCMLYDKEKFNSFNTNISYDEFCTNMITKFIEKAYQTFNKTDITFIYDDNIIEVFGRNLYFDAIIKSLNYLKEKCNIDFKYKFEHITNAAFGEVLSTELSMENNVYSLYTSKYCPYFINEKNYYNKLIDKELYENPNNENKYPYKAYIIDDDRQKYKIKPAKYLTILDCNAHITYYYTYSLINRKAKLYNIQTVDKGFMDIVEWVYGKSKKSISIGHKFKSLISNLSYFDQTDKIFIHDHNINLEFDDFYENSPIKNITDKLIEIKHEILRKHKYDKKVLYHYNIENISEFYIKDIELKQITFNGHCHRIMENYHYLIDYLNDNLVIANQYSSSVVVDKETGSENFTIRVNLMDIGYKYNCELIKCEF